MRLGAVELLIRSRDGVFVIIPDVLDALVELGPASLTELLEPVPLLRPAFPLKDQGKGIG